ncbi:MAG: 2-hydroxyacyl-CoA dehydratase [Desulfobacterales bacterium]|nr:2-hydroxyacyl-CoA dehydratase [Desulfobacterales bacterium]
MLTNKLVGFTCSYTPLPLIHAAGYAPYRLFPLDNSKDSAGHILHDNLCPHVKKILDRGIDNNTPEMSGVVFMNSCDAMRRLFDGWRKARPNDKAILIDFPATSDDSAINFFALELSRLWKELWEWNGRVGDLSSIKQSISIYNDLYSLFSDVTSKIRKARLKDGNLKIQELYNKASTEPPENIIPILKNLQASINSALDNDSNSVPIFLFGNVLYELDAFKLFNDCGAFICDDDLCTGSRLFYPINITEEEDLFLSLSKSIFSRSFCARTFDPKYPLKFAEDILNKAKACNAKGVIAHVLKFCDPYLIRLPIVREILKENSLPLLVLEGDCTLRSIGQQKTRIEAFIEMLR